MVCWQTKIYLLANISNSIFVVHLLFIKYLLCDLFYFQEYIKWKARRTIESIYFRVTTLLLIVIDLIIVIIDLSRGVNTYYGLKVADFIFSVYFVLEVSLRLLVLTPRVFFVHW